MQIRHIEDYAARFESLDSKELTELKKKLTKTRNNCGDRKRGALS